MMGEKEVESLPLFPGRNQYVVLERHARGSYALPGGSGSAGPSISGSDGRREML
jgi:hypothetical protein